MKKIYYIFCTIALLVLGYFAYDLGLILFKAFIGLMFIAVFGLGIWIGRLTKRSKERENK